MKVDVTAIFFNSTIEGGTATPPWCISIGQGKDKKINNDIPGLNDILSGLIYKSIQDTSAVDMSEGSRNNEYLLISLFDKIFINGVQAKDVHLLIALVREHTQSHDGRLRISIPPYAKYKNANFQFSNKDSYQQISNILGCGNIENGGCWFIDDISVQHQDELHLSCIVVDANKPMSYSTSQSRSLEWQNKSQKKHAITPTRSNAPFQLICYGAPGTGKSHKIKTILEQNKIPKDNIFRTTFHPDNDYSTFVGAYKPTMEKPQEILFNKNELINKLTELKKSGVTYAPQKFGAEYWYSLKQLNIADKKEILTACGMSDTYIVEFDKGTAIGEEYLAKSNKSHIIYSFVPQTFLSAYIQAYMKPDEKIFLIIEEINRGNCAQIFGDLFQLLDRDENGVSEYAIKADADLKAFLEEKLGPNSDGIKDGELRLPRNLYIYATMNTSDQSLFPIDSAFKRRWDWEYEPIKYSNTDWLIDIQDNKYSWVSFQKEINRRIFEATNSEDKMLGDYFVNPPDGVITAKILLNKILFYLWNDVCKDGEGDIFKTSDTDSLSFSELHGDSGMQKLIDMMEYLKVKKAE